MSVEPPLMRDVLNGVLNSRTDASGLYSAFPATQMTAAEYAVFIASGTNPVASYAFAPGEFYRYAGTGMTDDQILTVALSCNSRVYMPAGNFSFAAGVLLTSNKEIIGVKGSTGGTVITFADTTTVDGAVLYTTAYAERIRVYGLRILLPTTGKTQKGFKFVELRASTIEGCWVEGNGTAAADTTAVLINSPTAVGHYSGDVNIIDNYITAHLYGVKLEGSCTTVRVRDNEMYSNAASVVGSIAVALDPPCVGVLVSGNTFQGWVLGVYSQGTFTRLRGNYFEANTTTYQFVRGAGNARIWGQATGNMLVSGGAPIYPKNNVDDMVVDDTGLCYRDNLAIESGLGFLERSRTVNVGEWITPTFNAADYTANGTMTWTVIGANVVTLAYTLVGLKMTVMFRVVTTTVGGVLNSQLQIKIPGGFSSKKSLFFPGCIITNGAATNVVGLSVSVGGTTINISKDLLGAAFFAAGATDVYGEISFEIQ